MPEITKTTQIDISEDINRGFVVNQDWEYEKFEAYWNWCKQNNRISVEVHVYDNAAAVKIDPLHVIKPHYPFRFSDDQLDELMALAKKNHWQNGSTVTEIFSLLAFTKADAFAFAADVAEWLKTVTVVAPPTPKQLCGDCAHFERCKRLIQCSPKSESCDWIPSRFQEKNNADEPKALPEGLEQDQPAHPL